MIFRTTTKDDLGAFYDLYRMEHIESYGKFGMTHEQLAHEWEFPGFDMDLHTYGAHTDDGVMAGFAELRVWRDIPVRPALYGFVHPDYRGQGIGTKLTEWGIKQAEIFVPQCPPEARVVLTAFTNLPDGKQLLEDQGFTCTRQSYLMQIDLHDDMPQAQFPADYELLTMDQHPVLEDYIRVYQQTFMDHRGAIAEPLSAAVGRWKTLIDSGNYLPENFVLLRHRGEDAGVLILGTTSDEDPDKAFVQTLGVMPDYRRKGLATQLLYLAFELTRKLGQLRLGLGVDASSLTGANRLYEKVGFEVLQVYHAYELELRAGVELTKQG